MNAAIWLMTSALVAGGDPHASHGPAVISTGSACTNCGSAPSYHEAPSYHAAPSYGYDAGACCEPEKPGLLSRLRAHFRKGGDDCGCAPVADCGCETIAAPVACPCEPVCEPVCEPACVAEKPGLLSRLRAHFRKGGDDCGCAPVADCGCDTHGHSVYGNGAVTYPGHEIAPAYPSAPGSHEAQPLPPADTIPQDLPMSPAPMTPEGKIGMGEYPRITPVVAPKAILPLGGIGNPF